MTTHLLAPMLVSGSLMPNMSRKSDLNNMRGSAKKRPLTTLMMTQVEKRPVGTSLLTSGT